jgi:hypothetical protein
MIQSHDDMEKQKLRLGGALQRKVAPPQHGSKTPVSDRKALLTPRAKM